MELLFWSIIAVGGGLIITLIALIITFLEFEHKIPKEYAFRFSQHSVINLLAYYAMGIIYLAGNLRIS